MQVALSSGPLSSGPSSVKIKVKYEGHICQKNGLYRGIIAPQIWHVLTQVRPFFDFEFSINPLPDNKILDWSKLKQSADDNFEFDVDSRKFSKLVENTVGKGEIARYEQFLLFPQCFQKACFPGESKGVVWEWVKSFISK